VVRADFAWSHCRHARREQAEQDVHDIWKAHTADPAAIDRNVFHLVGWAWSLRRSLTGRGRPPRNLVMIAASAGSSVDAAVTGWLAVVLSGAAIVAVM
jgi:hypothetical protein